MKTIHFTDSFGRQWEIPLSAVEKDYRVYLTESGDDQPDVIHESVLITWFNEQFSFYEIKRDAKLVKDLSLDDKLKLLEQFIDSSMPNQIQSGADVDWEMK